MVVRYQRNNLIGSRIDDLLKLGITLIQIINSQISLNGLLPIYTWFTNSAKFVDQPESRHLCLPRIIQEAKEIRYGQVTMLIQLEFITYKNIRRLDVIK